MLKSTMKEIDLRIKARLLGIVLILFSLSCYNSLRADQIISPEGYFDIEGYWGRLNIPVCWEPNGTNYEAQKKIVTNALIDYIGSVSRVRFVGANGLEDNWSDCTNESLGIRVKIADEHPRSQVGRQFQRTSDGKRIQDGLGRYVELPTRMVLNFDFQQSFTFCYMDREHCIKAIAVHEFLHALGFLHEQLRPDAPLECASKYDHTKDFTGFSPMFSTMYYDDDSHVNYCANMYRRPIRLSEGDKAVLRRFY